MTSCATAALRHLRSVVAAETVGQLNDRRLLERFVAGQEEEAFSAILRRHGPLVMRVCRRVLNDWHASEDAFQATFLVLARKAASIRQTQSISGWLHGVAYRVALKARQRLARRPFANSGEPAVESSLENVTLRDLRRVIDEELQHLPEKYATPLILCYLEGRTRDEAAQQLEWPVGTFASRLDRGRELLRRRLVRRGVSLSAVLGSLLLVQGVEAATLPPALIASTTRAALAFAAGNSAAEIPATVLILAEGMVRSMAAMRGKLIAAFLLIGLLGSGAGVLWQSAGAQVPSARAESPAPMLDPPPRSDTSGDPLPAGALARMGTIRWRQGGIVTFVAYLADGKSLVSASRDGTVRIWDPESGKEVRRFGAREARPDPEDEDGDRETGLRIFTGSIYGSQAPAAALSPDGTILATSPKKQAIQLWDTATGKELLRIKTPEPTRASTLTFSADGKTLASRGHDHVIHFWDVASGKEIRQLKTREIEQGFTMMLGNSTPPLAFSPDGKKIGTTEVDFDDGNFSAMVQWWDVLTGKMLHEIKVTGLGAAFLAFSPDGKTLAFTEENSIHLVAADSGKEIHKFEGHKTRVQSLVFSRDSKLLVSRGTIEQGRNIGIHVWDVGTGKEVRHFADGAPGNGGRLGFLFNQQFGSPDLALAADGRTLATGGADNTIRRWNIETGKELTAVGGHHGPLALVALTPDGKTLFSQARDGTVRRWQAVTGKELGQWQMPAGSSLVAFHPNGTSAALAGRDAKIRLHDAANGKELRAITGHQGGCVALAFSPDGKLLVSRGGDDRTIHVYDTASDKRLRAIAVPAPENDNGMPVARFGGGAPIGLAVSPDGRLVCSQGPNQTLILWHLATGKEVRRLAAGHGSFAFSADGRTIAVEGKGGQVALWEVLTGKQRSAMLRKDEAPLKAGLGMMVMRVETDGIAVGASPVLTFSPDGRLLARRSADGSVSLLEVRTGRQVASLKGHQGGIKSVVFSADGKALASGSTDTTALLWDISPVIQNLKPPAEELTAGEVDALWKKLGSDATEAYPAIHRLASSPAQVVSVIRERVKPVAPVDARRLEQLVADLDSTQFAVRQKAAAELERLGDLVELALNKVLAGQPALETRQRIEKLLGQIASEQAPPERLPLSRALEVLELAGTPEAIEVLEAVAKGAPGARLTREAQGALQRVQQRK